MICTYFKTTDRATCEQDLANNGVLQLVRTGINGEMSIVPAPGWTFVYVGKVVSVPPVFSADMTMLEPPVYEPGEYANVYGPTAVTLGETSGTWTITAPANPVSTLFAPGDAPSTAPESSEIPQGLVSRRQFFLALYNATGITPTMIREQLASMGADRALIEFEAPYFDPANPLFYGLAPAFGLTSEQLDNIWMASRSY